MSAATRALVQIVAGLAVTGLMLVAAELVCGFFVPANVEMEHAIAFTMVENDTVSKGLKAIATNPVPAIEDLDLLWRNEPSSVRTVPLNPQAFGHTERTWEVRINVEGFRGPERELKDARDVYRILFIGDSVTYGYSVEERDSFARRVEAALRARYPDRRFDVVNGAVPGWTWVQGLRFLQLRGLALRPNLVIMAHGVNDQFFSAKVTDNERIKAMESPSVRGVELVRERVLHTNLYRVATRLVGRKAAQQEVSRGCSKQIRDAGICRRVGLDEIEAAVHEVRRSTTVAGVDLLVLNLDFLKTRANGAVERVVKADRIPFINFADQFDRLRTAAADERARRLGLAAAAARQMAKAGGRIVLRVFTGNATGPFMARGSSYPLRSAFEFDQLLYDDGTHGDEVAGDHVASCLVDVPTGVSIVHYIYYVNGLPEFASPHGAIRSNQGYREIRPRGDALAPIDVLGEQYLMVERTHPNAQGHQVIAAGVLDALGSIKSFADFVE